MTEWPRCFGPAVVQHSMAAARGEGLFTSRPGEEDQRALVPVPLIGARPVT